MPPLENRLLDEGQRFSRKNWKSFNFKDVVKLLIHFLIYGYHKVSRIRIDNLINQSSGLELHQQKLFIIVDVGKLPR